MPVGDPARGLSRHVDPGRSAEPEGLGLLDQGVTRVDVGGVLAEQRPEVVADAVEERVAGDLQGLGEVDHPVGLRLVVVEQAVADLEARGAVQAGARAVAVVERPDGHERLPGRARGELALVRARQQRVARLLRVEPGELLAGDAADPLAGVVGRLAGHRDHTAGLRLEHDRGPGVGAVVAVGDRVVRRARGRDRLMQCLLGHALDPGVDRGDQRVAGSAPDLALLAQHAAHRVDRDAAGSPAGRAGSGRTAPRCRPARRCWQRSARCRGRAGPA